MDLESIYKEFYDQEVNTHRAKADTDMVLDIFSKLNITCNHINKIVSGIKMTEI